MRSSGPQGGNPEAPVSFFPKTSTLSERGVCPLLDKTPKVRFRTVSAPTAAPVGPRRSPAPESEAPSPVATRGGGRSWESRSAAR